MPVLYAVGWSVRACVCACPNELVSRNFPLQYIYILSSVTSKNTSHMIPHVCTNVYNLFASHAVFLIDLPLPDIDGISDLFMREFIDRLDRIT